MILGLQWFEQNKAKGQYDTFNKCVYALHNIKIALTDVDGNGEVSYKEDYEILRGAICSHMVKLLFSYINESGGSIARFCSVVDSVLGKKKK